MMPVKYSNLRPPDFVLWTKRNLLDYLQVKYAIYWTRQIWRGLKPTNLIKMTIIHFTVSLVYRSVYACNLNFLRFLSVGSRNSKYVDDTLFCKYAAYMHRLTIVLIIDQSSI